MARQCKHTVKDLIKKHYLFGESKTSDLNKLVRFAGKVRTVLNFARATDLKNVISFIHICQIKAAKKREIEVEQYYGTPFVLDFNSLKKGPTTKYPIVGLFISFQFEQAETARCCKTSLVAL